MTKKILQIGFVISTGVAAFLLGLHIHDCKKEVKNKFKEFSVDTFFAQQQEYTPVVISYRYNKTKPTEKYAQLTVNGADAALCGKIVKARNNCSGNKPDVDYLIKWDENKEWFSSEDSFFSNRWEIFSLFVAD
jgi:hypothetical protein